MELAGLLNQRTIIDLNNIRLQQRDQEQNTPDDRRPISTIKLMNDKPIYCKVGGRTRQKEIKVVA